jgi:hypothetical protein
VRYVGLLDNPRSCVLRSIQEHLEAHRFPHCQASHQLTGELPGLYGAVSASFGAGAIKHVSGCCHARTSVQCI